MARRKTVVIGLLGTTLDLGKHQPRWYRWRPTVSLCQHEDLLVDRLELLSSRRYASLAKRVGEDIRQVSPETDVVHRELEFEDAWDLEEVYGSLLDFARAYPWAPEKEDYLVHITTGTHIAQISMFLLAEAHHIPARLIQTSPPTRGQGGTAGTYAIIDLDLSKYDRIAARFRKEATYSSRRMSTRLSSKVEDPGSVADEAAAPSFVRRKTAQGKAQFEQRPDDEKK